MAASLPSSFFTLEASPHTILQLTFGPPHTARTYPTQLLVRLQDTKLTKAVEAALSSFAILSAGHPDLPVLYASGRCCELLCSTKTAVVGCGLGQVAALSLQSMLQAAPERNGSARESSF